MNALQVKMLLILGFAIVMAVILGFMVAVGNIGAVILLAMAMCGIALFFIDNIPLLAIGVMTPFPLPLPFIHKFPFLLFILMVCVTKHVLKRWFTPTRVPLLKTYSLTIPFLVFFGWAFLHYCMDPVLPNLQGIGENVTGFRSYLNYGICFAVVVLFGIFLRTREDVLRFLKWMFWLSAGYSLFFIACALTRSETLGLLLNRMGVFISSFDNGILRVVKLPDFGILLVTVSILPNLLPMKKWMRVAFVFLGAVAVILGGTRSGLGMMLGILLAIPFAQRRYLRFGAVILGVGLFLIMGYIIGENVKGNVGLTRIFTLVNTHLADIGDATQTYEWRKARWDRAIQEIRNNPIIGKGYGGLENAWIFGFDPNMANEAIMDITIASGSVHNGYLACAMAFGIPGLILFLIAFLSISFNCLIRTRRYVRDDPQLSQLFCFIFVNTVSLSMTIYIGTDLNGVVIWVYLALGALLTKLAIAEKKTPRKKPAAEIEAAPVSPPACEAAS